MITGHDPIHAADVALKELADCCAQLTILLDNEIAPLPPLIMLRSISLLARMDAARDTLAHNIKCLHQTPTDAPAHPYDGDRIMSRTDHPSPEGPVAP